MGLSRVVSFLSLFSSLALCPYSAGKPLPLSFRTLSQGLCKLIDIATVFVQRRPGGTICAIYPDLGLGFGLSGLGVARNASYPKP